MKTGLSLQRLVVFLFIIALMPLPAIADENRNEAYELGEIVVVAPGSGPESVSTVTRISARELKDMGARTLDEGLRFVPGLMVRVGGAGTPRIDIRGLRTRHVLLLLNGIPVKNTYDDQFDPTTIPIDYIEEIKISTGATSQLYGPGGNGGVINIITKKGRTGTHGAITAEGSEVDTYLARGTVSHAGDKVNAFISASDYDRRAFKMSADFDGTADENGDNRDNSDIKRRNIFANLGYTPDENTTLGLTLNYLDGENGVPAATNYDKNDPFSRKPKFDRTDDIEGMCAQLAFNRKIGSGLGLRGWAYVNQLDAEDNRYDDAQYTTQKKKGAYSQDSTTDITGGNIQLAYEFIPAHTATLGLMMENDGWEADGFTIDKNDEKERLSTDEDLSTYSVVLEYNGRLTDRLGLILGCGQHFMDRDGGDNENAFSYSAGAWFDVVDGTRLKASHSRKVRFPSIRQLYDADTGNPDLSEENTYNNEIGVEQTLPLNSSLSITGYTIAAKDFIEKIGDDIYRNYEAYKFKGVDTVLESRAVDNLMVRLIYSYLKSKDKSPDTGRDQLQYRPEGKWSVETTYAFPFGLKAYASLLSVRDQYFYADDSPLSSEKKKLNNYTVVNLKISQLLLEDTLTLYIGADNLFDENYEQSYGLPQPGRTLYAGLDYIF